MFANINILVAIKHKRELMDAWKHMKIRMEILWVTRVTHRASSLLGQVWNIRKNSNFNGCCFFFVWYTTWNPISKINTTSSSFLIPTKILWNQFHLVLGYASAPKTPLTWHQTGHRPWSSCPKYVRHNHPEHHL